MEDCCMGNITLVLLECIILTILKTLLTQGGKQTIQHVEVYFDHDSKATFQDKLLRVILADLPVAANQ